MKSLRRGLLLGFLGVLTALSVSWTVRGDTSPELFTVQVRLVENGQPVTTVAPRELRFSVYDGSDVATATTLWTVRKSVTITAGILSAALGSGDNPATGEAVETDYQIADLLNETADRYLGISDPINGDVQLLTPFIQLTAVPYSMNARTAIQVYDPNGGTPRYLTFADLKNELHTTPSSLAGAGLSETGGILSVVVSGFSPQNYTPDPALVTSGLFLSAHLKGLDDKLNTISGTVLPSIAGGRISISDEAVPSAGTPPSGTIYYPRHSSPFVALHHGSKWRYYPVSQVGTFFLGNEADGVFDLFAFAFDETVVENYFKKWSSTTARGFDLEDPHDSGILHGPTGSNPYGGNQGRYLGTVYLESGMVSDEESHRGVWNYQNQVSRRAHVETFLSATMTPGAPADIPGAGKPIVVVGQASLVVLSGNTSLGFHSIPNNAEFFVAVDGAFADGAKSGTYFDGSIRDFGTTAASPVELAPGLHTISAMLERGGGGVHVHNVRVSTALQN